MTKRDYDDQPTAFGGVRDNRRNPITGRSTSPSPGQAAQDMRREGFRSQDTMPGQDRREANRRR